VDRGGSINVLTSERWTDIGFANAQHTIMAWRFAWRPWVSSTATWPFHDEMVAATAARGPGRTATRKPA
jgi:hypothetical protein